MGQVLALMRPGAARQTATGRPLPDMRDRAFLPAALAIIETPASPVRIAMLLTICALAAAGIAWACIGTIDIHATARGKIEPAGHVKVVQPLQPGTVASIPVTEGERVAAGDVVLQLDAREARAALEGTSFARSAAEAEALRRSAEIAAIDHHALGTPPLIAWPDAIPAATRRREQAVLDGNLAQLSATLANLDDQRREKEAAVDQLDRSIEAETYLLRPLAERVSVRQTLFAEGNNSRLALLDAEQTLLETRAQLAGDQGRRDMAQAAIATLRSERQRTLQAFLAEDEQRLADARKMLDEKTDEQMRDQARLDELTLRAPMDGVVQALAITNVGQVVASGQEVMRIVPDGAKLQVLAYITNDDIGFVRPGQTAVIKLDSFPFTRFGTIDAEVTRVAYDALPADQANHAVTDAAKASRTKPDQPSATPMTDLVFEATLQPKTLAMLAGDQEVPLTSGMTVTVEVKTGRRRVMEYLLSSVVEITSMAGTER